MCNNTNVCNRTLEASLFLMFDDRGYPYWIYDILLPQISPVAIAAPSL